MSNTSGTATDQQARPGKTSSKTATSATPLPPPPTPSFIFRGHDAPIHSLEFFASNTFLATGDETGWICVWDIWKRRPVCKWHAHKTGSILALKAISIRGISSTPSSTADSESKSTTQSASERSTRRKAKAAVMAQAQEDRVYIVSHGRDNEIHFWDINSVLQKSVKRTSTIGIINLSDDKASHTVAPVLSLPVNALNFCKMAILAIDETPVVPETLGPLTEPAPPNESLQGATATAPEPTDTTPMRTGAGLLRKTHQHIYVAVPSPTTSSLIDIYDVTKPERTFAAVGPLDSTTSSNINNPIPSGSDKKWGSAMSINLFLSRGTTGDDGGAPASKEGTLHMLVGYEDGSVTMFRDSTVVPAAGAGAPSVTNNTNAAKKGKRTMEVAWSTKYHREPVLAVDVSSKAGFAISCGSDNVLARYDLSSSLQGTPEVLKVALKANGMADGKIRDDQKVIALAGWDGRIRLFSAKSLKPLAVLKYHREGLYCLSFADIKEPQQQQQQQQGDEEGEQLEAPSSLSALPEDSATPNTNSTAEAIATETNDDNKGGNNEDSDDESSDESGSESDSNSELEDALADRQRWSNRHWIAVGGKEQRISLWDIY
ncbi:Guanine nucleotide binding protein (G protein), beta polypeptide 1-like [Mortierella sp. 14UC]|nr:Guanine nucleotide binding protein (G protein), beta polypeptide 1-like [Mortierella sp. 14UC]